MSSGWIRCCPRSREACWRRHGSFFGVPAQVHHAKIDQPSLVVAL